MAYDEALADRVDAIIGARDDVTDRRMFGGLAFLVNGNMAVAVRGSGGLLVRVAPAEHDGLLSEPGAETMVMRGRPLTGWLTVAAEQCVDDAVLSRWVKRGVAFASSLKPKQR